MSNGEEGREQQQEKVVGNLPQLSLLIPYRVRKLAVLGGHWWAHPG
jgi:hypothetical protein